MKQQSAAFHAADAAYPVTISELLYMCIYVVMTKIGQVKKFTGDAMIQTRNQYLQFMLVMLAAWGISWGARFVMEQAVLLYGSGKTICSSVMVLF